jgi:hypothetical protein
VFSSTDTESGITEYQYAIGTIPGGTSPVDWTTVVTSSNVVEITKTGLTLNTGTIYYITVKTKNNTGVTSSPGYSDGIVYDDVAVLAGSNKPVPQGAVSVTNSNYKYVLNTATIAWQWPVVTDNISGLAVYYVSVGTKQLTADDVIQDTTTVANSFVYSDGKNKTVYYSKIKYKDNAGNVSAYSSVSDGVLIDTVSPPVPVLQNPADFGWDYITPDFYWSTVQDDESGLDRYVLQLSTAVNFGVVSYSSSTKNFFVTNIVSLPAAKYWWRVGSIDMAGNISYTSARQYTKSGIASKLVLASSTGTIKSDGIDAAVVTAIVTDDNNNRVEDAVNIVTFTVTANGILSGTYVAATSGTLSIQLTAVRSSEPVTVTAVSDGLTTVSTVTVNTYAFNVPYKIELTSQKNSIIANNRDINEIVAIVKDMYGNQIFGQSIPVKFTTNEYGVLVGSKEAVTDPSIGKAVITMKSSTTVSAITVYGYNDGLSTGTVTVPSVPDTADHIGLSVDGSGTFTADGESTATVKIRIYDSFNNTVSLSGIRVIIEIIGLDYGVLAEELYKTPDNYPYIDTVSGYAEFKLKSTKKAGRVQVRATDKTSGLNLIPGTINIITGSSDPVKVVLTSQKSRLVTGQESTVITARIVDMNDNTVESSTQPVLFSVYAGLNKRAGTDYTVIATSGVAEYVYSDTVSGRMIIKGAVSGLADGYTEILNVWNKTAGGDYLFFDNRAKLVMPVWSMDKNIRIELSTGITLSAGIDTAEVSVINNTIKEFTVFDENDVQLANIRFNHGITVTISYDDVDGDNREDTTNTDVNKLRMYYVDETTNKLVWVRTSAVDKINKTVTATIDHLSIYLLGAFSNITTAVYQNYPNPFNPAVNMRTRIEYAVGDGAGTVSVSFKVYNAAGELVRKLYDGDVLSGTKLYVDWDGKNDSGQLVSDGVYICQLVAPSFKKSIKILLIK